jgi:hypothetical protein
VNDATPNSPSMNNAPFCPLSQPRFSIPLPRSVSDSRAAAGSAFPSPSRLGRAPFSAPATGVQPASAAETRSSQLGTPEDGFGISGNAPRGEATLTVSQGRRSEEERGLGVSLLRRARNIPDCSWRSWALRSLIWRWRTEACRMAQGRGSGVEWRANVKARNRRERLSYATISVLAGARTWFVQLAGCTVLYVRAVSRAFPRGIILAFLLATGTAPLPFHHRDAGEPARSRLDVRAD